MKTITYNPDTHRLVPVEPTEEMLRKAAKIDLGKDCDEEGICCNLYQVMLSAAPQPEPVELRETQLVEVEPVLYAEFSEDGGWLGEVSEYQDHLEEPIALYTAPPDYEEIKRQRDELAKALENISTGLRRAGASIPAPENKGTIESAMATGLSIALLLVEDALASVKGGV